MNLAKLSQKKLFVKKINFNEKKSIKIWREKVGLNKMTSQMFTSSGSYGYVPGLADGGQLFRYPPE